MPGYRGGDPKLPAEAICCADGGVECPAEEPVRSRQRLEPDRQAGIGPEQVQHSQRQRVVGSAHGNAERVRIVSHRAPQRPQLVLGKQLANSPVVDIQITPTSPRKVLFAFQSGAVAVYDGN